MQLYQLGPAWYRNTRISFLVWSFLGTACIKASTTEDPIDRRLNPPSKDANDKISRDLPGGDRPSREGQGTQGAQGEEAPLPQGTKLPAPAAPVEKAQVKFITGAHFYYNDDQDQARRRTFKVDLPEAATSYGKITLETRLYCPAPACDSWDRVGSLGMETTEGVQIEIHRFVTAYGVGQRMSVDVTDFATLLKGPTQFWVQIDTWSGPRRDGGRYGGGWLLDAQLVYEPGTPARKITHVIPLIQKQYVTYGRPQEPTLRQKSVEIPEGTSAQGTVLMFITGHGQGNTENCAEFCPKTHQIRMGEQEKSQTIWRDNCASTVTDGRQRGTYTYSRAGWCPGAAVAPWRSDVTLTPQELAQQLTQFQYRPQAYTNRLDSGYNDQGHTLPQYLVSGVLFLGSIDAP